MANQSFQSFGKENVGEFKLLTFNELSGSGIWLGNILAYDVCFAKNFPPPPFYAIRYVTGPVKINHVSVIFRARTNVATFKRLFVFVTSVSRFFATKHLLILIMSKSCTDYK